MLKKLIYIFIVVFTFFGCSSNKKVVINSLISEINVPINGKISDTIRIINYSSNIHQDFFNNYLKAEAYSKNSKIDGDFYWDKNYRWSIDKKDIEYLDKINIKSEKRKLKKTHFVNEIRKIILVEKPIKITNDDNSNAINTGKYTYCITNPIFNKKRI